jgi:protein involved in polysaccharide export with SLBB domain
MKKLILFSLLGVAAALFAGCKSPTGKFESRATGAVWPPTNLPGSITLTNPLSPEMLKPAQNLFTLGPGDSIEIEMLGMPTSRIVTPVGPDGKIYYSLLPGVDVWGLTLSETTELLEKDLAKYFSAPHVSVTLRAVGSKYVWLLGRLNKPGIYPLTGPTTLLELVAQAGGTARSSSAVTTDDIADLRHSFIVRHGQFLPVNFHKLLHDGDTSQNIYLQPDDFIYVPSSLSQEVYVLGAVKYPRALAYTERATLVSAIAGGSGMERYNWISAGGSDTGPFTKDAYMSHVAILRGSLSEPQIAVVDYNAIIGGKAPDVRLEPGDIVFVPNSPYTNLKRYFNIMLNTFVTTVAANEGIRAGGGTVGVGVSVPVGGR